MLNRYLAGDQITPRLVWENVKEQVVRCANGHIVFDDDNRQHDLLSDCLRQQLKSPTIRMSLAQVLTYLREVRK
jgi:hypothetical protein